MERQRLGKWLLVMACVSGLGAPAARATDLCGTTVIDDVKLSQDLVCSGDGLIVGANGIRIDLNGFSIQGSGTGTGVAVSGYDDVTIAGGAIRQFAVGIRVATSTESGHQADRIRRQRRGDRFPGGKHSQHGEGQRLPAEQHPCDHASQQQPGERHQGQHVCRQPRRHPRVRRRRQLDQEQLHRREHPGRHSGQRDRDRERDQGQHHHEQRGRRGVPGHTDRVSRPATSSRPTPSPPMRVGSRAPTAGNDIHDNSFESNTTDTCP